MRKRITVFVVLMMVVCLALAGCAQNINKQEANRPGENFDTGDSSIMDGTNNPDGSTSEHEAITDTNDESIPDGAAEEAARNGDDSSGGIDNHNPRQGTDGMYIYQVRGHEVKLSINIWDYIGSDTTDNFFKLTSLARYYGYGEKYNYD